MSPEDRTSRTPPPSFAPGAPARPVRPKDAEPIVVGRPSRPTAPPPRPARQAPAAQPPARQSPATPATPATPRTSTRQAPATPTAPRTPARPPTIPPAGQSARPAQAAAPVEVGRQAAQQTAPAAPPSAPRSTSSRPAGSRPPQRVPAPAGGGRPPAAPVGPRTPVAPAEPTGKPRHRKLIIGSVAVLVLAALIAWPIGLTVWANGKVQHTAALSGAAGTPGTTYLLTGSDSRADGAVGEDGTEGSRTDTILLLHVPDSGPTALISLPRDTYVDVPGNGPAKLNAAFSWGQAPLLVQTVEGLTGLTVDHYAEIGMAGVEQIVDAVGGVNLCYDVNVHDPDSGLEWAAGCHDVAGPQALAFARMRKADPTGDVGRAERQRQLIGAVMAKVKPSQLALRPGQQVALVDAGTGALTVDDGSGILDMGKLALAFRAANGPDGITGTPPISSINYRPGGNLGSTVLLDPDASPAFWLAIRDGSLPPGPVGGMPAS